jgi:hypothetical protein
VTVDPVINALLVACVALLFASAAFHKLRDLRRFDEIFNAYGLVPWRERLRLSRLVPLVEGVMAGGLLFDESRQVAAAAGSVLLLAYAGAIAWNLSRGRRDLACGCGGPNDRRPIAAWMIWRNVFLAMLATVVMLPVGARMLSPTDVVTIVFGAATCSLAYLCADRLLSQPARLSSSLRM